jgi:superfamily II DNA or RNA helicase
MSRIHDHILKFNTLIRETSSYGDFAIKFAKMTSEEKGIVQEIFAKQYFLAHAKLYDVKEYCARILKDSIPEGVNEQDLGSDGIITHTDGRISLVQVKYRADPNKQLNRNSINGMSLEALALKGNFANMYLFANTLFEPTNITEREKGLVKFILLDKIFSCDWSLIQPCVTGISNVMRQIVRPVLRYWQQEAHAFVLDEKCTRENGFNFGRKSAISACGTGKTLMADTIINHQEIDEESGPFYIYERVLILVPNLHLLSQWFEKIAIWHPDRNYLLIGSDLDDEGTRIPYTLTTNVEDIITKCLQTDLICICTYQSLPRLMETNCAYFDVTVCDEAHVTAGSKGSFNLPTQPNFISENTLFITATPRIYKGNAKEECVSMDDESVYGPQYVYSFKKAIEDKIISDYRIIIGQGEGQHDNTEFNALFLKRSIEKEDLKSVLVFSSNHVQSKALYVEFRKIFKGEHKLVLMIAGANSKKKSSVIHLLNTGKPIIIFNVRVFSLGSDLIPLQAVMLSGDKGSIIDIIQSVSRCLRKHDDKDHGTILVPCLVETDDFNGPGTFAKLRTFLSAMASVDDSIKDEIVLRALGKPNDKRKIYTDMIIESKETMAPELCKSFDLRMFTSLGKSIVFSPELQFALLEEFCIQRKQLPGQKEEYKGIRIGTFFGNLLGGKVYKKNRNNWISKLLEIKDISKELQIRIDNIQDEIRKASRSVPAQKRFNVLYEFCVEEQRLPGQKEKIKDIGIGSFLERLLNGSNYKNIRDDWIRKLLEIDDINEELQGRINNKQDETKKASRSVTSQERYDALREFCIGEKRLPFNNEEYRTIKIYNFLNGLLGGRNYKNTRDKWIKELLELEDIQEELQTRINNAQDETKKASRSVSSQERYDILREFCIGEKRLPKQTEKHKNIMVGMFLANLLGGHVKDIQNIWIKELLEIEDIKEELQERIDNTKDEVKKASRSITPQERFKATKEFCIQEGRLPLKTEQCKNIKIGDFLNCLLGGKVYKNTRDDWIKELLEIENIKEELQGRIDIRRDEDKKISRSITPQKRFETLKKFCIQEGRLPIKNEDYDGIKLGNFLDGLLGRDQYVNIRDKWIEELLEIDEIKEELQSRIDNRKDETRKASRSVTPTERFEAMKEFCIKEQRLPLHLEKFKEISIGQFLNHLLGGKLYKNTRDNWIKELLELEDIQEELQTRINNTQDETKKASRLVTPTERFKATKEFCVREGRLPSSNEEYKNIKIGNFFTNLITGHIRINRDEWINALLLIKSIKVELTARLQKRGYVMEDEDENENEDEDEDEEIEESESETEIQFDE